VQILVDYCAVGSVKDMINATLEPLEEPQIAYVTLGMLKGLAFLHSQGIMHLDVKAANIMINQDGQVKLGMWWCSVQVIIIQNLHVHCFVGDFGVSMQIKKGTSRVGAAQQLVGSPLYMAPEVIRKEPYDTKVLFAPLFHRHCSHKHYSRLTFGLWESHLLKWLRVVLQTTTFAHWNN
jgi:serine/threonine protein kinase